MPNRGVPLPSEDYREKSSTMFKGGLVLTRSFDQGADVEGFSGSLASGFQKDDIVAKEPAQRGQVFLGRTTVGQFQFVEFVGSKANLKINEERSIR